MQTQAISPTIRSSTTNDNLTVHCSLHPGSGYPGHPRLLFWIHLQQPDGFGFGTAVQILCPTCDAQRAGPRHRQHLGPTKGAKVLEVRFRRYWTWAMGWCGRRIFMAYVMPWPRQLSKNPLFAPNASLSSLEGDDKEPSCAGEAILAWKSSQSHPLFMRKQWKTMKDNERQCMTMPFLPLGHKMPRSSTKMNSYQYKYHEPSPPRCSFAVDEQRLGSGCREHQVEGPARPGSWMVTWSLFNERSIMFNFRGLFFIHRWFILIYHSHLLDPCLWLCLCLHILMYLKALLRMHNCWHIIILSPLKYPKQSTEALVAANPRCI